MKVRQAVSLELELVEKKVVQLGTGYYGGGALGVIIVILLVLILMGRL